MAITSIVIATLPGWPVLAGAMPAPQILELDVIVNGNSIGMIGEFLERGGDLFLTAHELKSLGFRNPPAEPASRAAPEIRLASVPGVSYRLDEMTQTIFITADNAALTPNLLQAAAGQDEQNVPVRSGLGADLDYDLVDTYLNGQTLGETFLNAHGFSSLGLLDASAIETFGAASNLPPFLRLDTTYSYADVAAMQRFAAGDFITGGLTWSRPVRMAGLQIDSDFGVRPDLVTFPVPTIAGQVAVPSSVDVLVNGVQLLSQNVSSGPFQIDQLPVVTGAGTVSVVTRDSAGQQSSRTLPIYTSTLLLRPGLAAYSAEIGTVRLNYGFQSNDYRALAATLTYRYGLSDWLTLEGHGEAVSRNDEDIGDRASAGGMGGGGVAFTLGHLGVASLDAAASDFGGRTGAMVSATAERLSDRLSFSGSIQLADRKFADIAAAFGQPFPVLQGRLGLGLALPSFGSLGLAFVEMQQPGSRQYDQPMAGSPNSGSGFDLSALALVPQAHVALLSGTFSREILDGRAYAYGTAFDDLSDADSAGFMIGITLTFGNRGSASASIGGGDHNSDQTLQASESANDVGDFGWQVAQGAGGQSQQQANVIYKSSFGLIDAGADRVDGQTAYRGGIEGALALTDGHVFATNTIDDSFAVVDTDRTPGVEVLQENRVIGKTGPAGIVLVPNLTSFGINHLSIDPIDVPLDADVGSVAEMVRTQERCGVVVHFRIHPSHGAIVHLVDQQGADIPVDSVGQLLAPATRAAVTIGYDGEAYFTGLAASNTAKVTLPGGASCIARFAYRQVPGSLPEIGPVACAVAPP